jgi:hypothetical protein
MGRTFCPPAVIGTLAQNPLAATINGLTVTLGRGTTGVAEASIVGFFHVIDAADWSVTVPANTNATMARVDRIVLRWNPATERADLALVQGVPSASPTAPDLVQLDSGIWELPLWRFTVPANSGAPLTGLTDDRRLYNPMTGGFAIGQSITAYTTAAMNVTSIQAVPAVLTGLSAGLWEVEFTGLTQGGSSGALAYLRVLTADGLTNAASDPVTSPNPTVTRSSPMATHVPGSSSLVTATTGNGQEIATGAVANNSGAALGLARVVLRVLTPGSLTFSLGSSIVSQNVIIGAGSRFRATLIGV